MKRKFDTLPKSNQVNYSRLKILLNTKFKKRWFCFHDWVYWKYGDATKTHRVCCKCFKKQKDKQVFPKHKTSWIVDKEKPPDNLGG